MYVNLVSDCGITGNSLSPNFFRQINSLLTYLVKPLLSRNFCQKCVREFSHCGGGQENVNWLRNVSLIKTPHFRWYQTDFLAS